MKSSTAAELLSALAHEGRLSIFRLLVRRSPGDVPAGEIAETLGLQRSTASNQLSELERVGLIISRRDGRSILYRADLEQAGALLFFLGGQCCQGRAAACEPLLRSVFRRMADETDDVANNAAGSRGGDNRLNILFLCTANSARSLFAEAILRDIGGQRFNVFSAGSSPRGEPHPRALTLLRSKGHGTADLRSKSWEAFAQPDAPVMDIVVSVCDAAANEECPNWPTPPMTSHWSIPDPVVATGAEAEIEQAFASAYEQIASLLESFVHSLSSHAVTSLRLRQQLDVIALQAQSQRR